MPEFTPMPDDFMNVIFGDIYKKLTNGGDPTMLGPNNFIAWEPVATALDKKAFDYAAKGFFGLTPKVEGMTDEMYNELRNSKKYEKYAHAEEFARLADQIPSNIPELDGKSRKFTIFNPAPDHTVSNVYSDIMEFCVVKDSKIDPKVEKKLETLRKQLFTIKKLPNPDFDDTMVEHPDDNPKVIIQSFPSPKYVKYLEYEAKFYEVEDRWVDLMKRVQNGDPDAMAEMNTNGDNLKNQRAGALKRWETLGYKGAVEKVMNYIDEIESSNFITVKKRYETELAAAKRTGLGGTNAYFFSAPLPANILNNVTGWQTFTFSKSSYDSSSRSTTHSWGGHASFIGIVGISAGGSHTRMNSEFNFNDFRMSFKLTKCYITRPWLGMTFIKSRFWKYSKTGNDIVNNQMVSDGNGKGLMPAVTTELYLVSDLNIGFVKGSNSWKKAEDHIKAGGLLNIGPFTLGGAYGYDDSRVESHGTRESQGITSSGILLVGRKCNILDMAPNPLPTIKDDEWVEVS